MSSSYEAVSRGELAHALEVVAQFFERSLPPVLEIPVNDTKTIQRQAGSVIAVENHVMVAQLRGFAEGVVSAP